jgi:alpha-amylase/alpha-mannosidase (GH57 family)
MKKYLFSLFIFILFVSQIFGQNDRVSLLVNRCISLLDKPVPNGFRQVGAQVFYSDEGILLMVFNENVIVSTKVDTFRSEREANRHNTLFSNYLKNNNWDFVRTSSMGAEIYFRDGLHAIIEKPRKHNNGTIETMIGFSRNLNLDNM